MPNEPMSHAFLTEEIMHKLRGVAEATSSALDAMIDSDPAYRAGMEAAVRAMGRAINLDPFDDDAKVDPTGYHMMAHLRRDVRNILESVYDATISALESGGASNPAYREGFSNTLRSVARGLDLYREGDEPMRERPITKRSQPRAQQPPIVEQPQHSTQHPRQLPAPVEGAYYLESRSGRTASGLEQYMARYGIASTVTTDATGRAEICLHGVSEARREWAEYVINKWSDDHGWKRQEENAGRSTARR